MARTLTLVEEPRLVWPTPAVRDSYLEGERADCIARGTPTDWLADAASDFDGFVTDRRGVKTRWGVPSTIFWYVAGSEYIGTLVIRHRLTEELFDAGGHVGYHVVVPWQRQGHATRMLAEGLDQCRRLGLGRVLLTCSPENDASKRVILANGGVYEDRRRGDDRYWINLDNSR